eukprot:CAMPEP_0194226572 /NCGR_PEP_ID=MMETSP0156-20130528/42144_1 /TAXON_ID=33649 /ORGANISM="Thalassionema nitzschioides, Strain L26-B" /LENGTH=650 /DNA_ID=CAMNT_0038958967 /DNA_START=96 /DNA_END=2048 /DNA_ORIENTATION=+
MPSSKHHSRQKFDLSIGSSDVLCLIQAHLSEHGLTGSLEALQNESGVKAAGSVNKNWQQWAARGEWGIILQQLAKLDLSRGGNRNLPTLMSEVYEMSILELGEKGELAVAYATLRLVAHSLDQIDDNTKQASNLVRNSKELTSEQGIPKSRQLEQKLAALSALRKNKPSSIEEALLPPNYYSRPNKQSLRDELGHKLMESIPQVPSSRLMCLLQQAVQWQAHTGQFPLITQYYNADEGDDDATRNNIFTKKRACKKRTFDLVLGKTVHADTNDDDDNVIHESIVRKVYTQVSFGKKAAPQVAVFHPDGGSLITGSSDGLIEIWDPSSRYQELRMDLSYQQNEELLGHDDNVKVTALAISPDGHLLATGDANGLIKVWKILGDGVCLRKFQAHLQSWISCLQFNPNASVLLTASHDTTCREYGLRSQGRLLKEFRGHSSFVTQCAYHLSNDSQDDDEEEDWILKVVTASADGTVRLWDAATSELLHIIRPPSASPAHIGASILIPISGSSSTAIDTLEIHSIFVLPKNQLLLVPRSSCAYLISLSLPTPGTVLQTYSISSPKKTGINAIVMVAAACSSHWFYAVTNHGSLHVFDIDTGNQETTRASFGSECGLDEEISSLILHPHQTLLAAFSNQLSSKNKTKKHFLTLWK